LCYKARKTLAYYNPQKKRRRPKSPSLSQHQRLFAFSFRFCFGCIHFFFECIQCLVIAQRRFLNLLIDIIDSLALGRSRFLRSSNFGGNLFSRPHRF